MSELYEFRLGGEVWRYTSSAQNLFLEGVEFIAAPLSREEIENRLDAFSAVIKMPLLLPPASKFRALNPAGVIWVSLLREDGKRLFMGRIASCSYNLKKGEATLRLTSLQGILKNKIPSRIYSRECPFELFSSSCGVDRGRHKITIPPDGYTLLSPTEISAEAIGAKESGYFEGGVLSFGDEAIHILEHRYQKIVLLYPVQAIEGATLTLTPGCPKTLGICRARFDNERNYGGFPFVPQKNPITEGF